MSKQYLLAEQTITKEDLDDLIAWLKTNPWLTQGPLVREFEQRWAEWLGVRHATFVNSGSSANLLMYYALLLSRLPRNNKIVVPAVSWATTIAPVIQLGYEPLMCDAGRPRRSAPGWPRSSPRGDCAYLGGPQRYGELAATAGPLRVRPAGGCVRRYGVAL